MKKNNMYFGYLSRVVISFLIGSYSIIKALRKRNNIETENYKKIGLYLNSNCDQYIPYEEKQTNFITVLIYLLIESIGSWLTILIHIIRYFYLRGKNTMIPINVLSFNNEMKQKNLSVEEIHKLLKKHNLAEEKN